MKSTKCFCECSWTMHSYFQMLPGVGWNVYNSFKIVIQRIGFYWSKCPFRGSSTVKTNSTLKLNALSLPIRTILFAMTVFDELRPWSNKVLFTVNLRLCLTLWSLSRKQSVPLNANVFTHELTPSPYVQTTTSKPDSSWYELFLPPIQLCTSFFSMPVIHLRCIGCRSFLVFILQTFFIPMSLVWKQMHRCCIDNIRYLFPSNTNANSVNVESEDVYSLHTIGFQQSVCYGGNICLQKVIICH